MVIKFYPADTPELLPAKLLQFGTSFSNYYFCQDYLPPRGWQKAEIRPLAKEKFLSPLSSVLHYGQQVFEGMKAFKWQDQKIRIFRPNDHFTRLNHSAKFMQMPILSVVEQLQALKFLLKVLGVYWLLGVGGGVVTSSKNVK